jgi:hypothetical protein
LRTKKNSVTRGTKRHNKKQDTNLYGWSMDDGWVLKVGGWNTLYTRRKGDSR